jgi:hypothetical protein
MEYLGSREEEPCYRTKFTTYQIVPQTEKQENTDESTQERAP